MVIDMKIEITLEEAYARASSGLRQKMEYSIRLLRRAERLALAYDPMGGGITSHSVAARTRRLCCISLSWRVYDLRDT